MSKRKHSKGENVFIFILVILLVVGLAWFILYKNGNPLAQKWATKLGIVERVTLERVAWVWERTELLDGSIIEAPDNSFVLSFIAEEDRFTSTTDCNTLMGSYLLNNNMLRFGEPASTKMFCLNSTEEVYAHELALVNSYKIRGENLYFNLDRDFGVMVFEKK